MSILRFLLNLLIEQENGKSGKRQRQTGNPPSPRIRRIDVKHQGKVKRYKVNQYGEIFNKTTVSRDQSKWLNVII